MKYVMSDIHGHYESFKSMLKQIGFKKGDDLYVLGDIIDRGPNSIELIKYIMSSDNIHMILGNHEDMMLYYYETFNKFDRDIWFHNGGNITNFQFKFLSEAEQVNILHWLKNLPVIKKIKINNKIYVLGHACPWGKDKEEIVWERIKPKNKAPDNNYYIVGHTPTSVYNDKPIILKNIDEHIFFIDCGSGYNQKLGCLRLDDLKEFYIDIREVENEWKCN